MPEMPDLSLTEWVVLTLVDEGPVHGFAVAALTAADGAVGRVWAIRRPLVYRALSLLAAENLVEEVGEQPGQGPTRHPYTVTDRGHEAAVAWLDTPVEHVRQMRSELLVKLALLDRRALDPAALLRRQRRALAPIANGLTRYDDAGVTGFEATLAAWRRANVEAAISFLDVMTGRPGH